MYNTVVWEQAFTIVMLFLILTTLIRIHQALDK